MNTYALCFLCLTNGQGGNSSFTPVRSIDSEHFTPPPTDSCYIRIINGIPDAPGPFFVDIDDTLGNSIFYANSKPQSIPNGSFSYYALIPAGQHLISLRLDDSNNPKTVVFSQQPINFKGGEYYTIVATGSYNMGGSVVIGQE